MQNLPEINNQLENNNLFAAFKTQLLKDVEQSNFPTDSLKDITPDYYSIHFLIATLLEHSEGSSQHNIMQLIYRVDISEAQLSKYLNERHKENYFDVIAELIIKRVLQKVVVRLNYET